MGRDTRATLFTLLLLGVCILLQSTLLSRLPLGGARPDLALIVLVYASLRRGSMVGQVSGFVSGLFEDFMSVSPLGFHPLLKTVIGYLYGIFSGNMFLDPIFMPMILTIVATLLKGVLSGLVSSLFGIAASGFLYFRGRLWIELGLNTVLSPFLFALLGLFKVLKPSDKEGA